MSSAGSEILVKLLLIGESSVGKSCLLLRFSEDKFTDDFLPTIGIDFKVRHTVINDRKVKLQVWDTAGQEKFRTITKAYYRGAQGMLLVFDVTNWDSFDKVRNWMTSIQENTTDPVTIYLVGNKCDVPFPKGEEEEEEGKQERLVRRITQEKAQELAREFNVEYFETSARDGTNVESTFLRLAGAVLEKMPAQERKEQGVTLAKTRKDPKDGRRSCC